MQTAVRALRTCAELSSKLFGSVGHDRGTVSTDRGLRVEPARSAQGRASLIPIFADGAEPGTIQRERVRPQRRARPRARTKETQPGRHSGRGRGSRGVRLQRNGSGRLAFLGRSRPAESSGVRRARRASRAPGGRGRASSPRSTGAALSYQLGIFWSIQTVAPVAFLTFRRSPP